MIHELQRRRILQTVTRREMHECSFPPGLSMTQLTATLERQAGTIFSDGQGQV